MSNRTDNKRFQDQYTGKLGRTIRWLEGLPEVAKIVAGHVRVGKTRHPDGTVRITATMIGADRGLKAKGVFEVGERDLFIYLQPGKNFTPAQFTELMAQRMSDAVGTQQAAEQRSDSMIEQFLDKLGPVHRELPLMLTDAQSRLVCAEPGVQADAFIKVTPELASVWLETCIKTQRRLNDAYVKKYAADMMAGRWNEDSPQGLIFAGNPFRDHARGASLLDGQHRLWAVFTAGVTVQLKVSVNVPEHVQRVLDDGYHRSDADVYRIVHGGNMTTRHSAIARALFYLQPGGRAALSRTTVMEKMERHAAQIDKAYRLLLSSAPRGLGSAVVAAMLVRAQYHLPAEVIERFARVFKSGMPELPCDQAVVLLRNLMLGMNSNNKRTTAAEEYLKAERAIVAMHKGEVLGRLYEVDREVFPLPEEQGGQA